MNDLRSARDELAAALGRVTEAEHVFHICEVELTSARLSLATRLGDTIARAEEHAKIRAQAEYAREEAERESFQDRRI